MPNKPKERVQGCRLPSWLPQGAEAGRYVNLFPKGNTVCREKQTGKVPQPAINGKVVRFKRELCTVKANFRTAELTSIAGKFLPVEMQYAAFLALALPVYEKPIVAKAKAEKTEAKAAKAVKLGKASKPWNESFGIRAARVFMNAKLAMDKAGFVYSLETEALFWECHRNYTGSLANRKADSFV